ncbi:hypothetical protein Ais01nite_73730 [Asanoa ishikariensis]|uniref:Uncharacterized protein n=1 Tax=Asanoa ishikariensis TaxID=137265 RepID=A0A1H3URD4_9ACTN|nr:hypothetical protein [Asanoa ishikariensis]GIF69338.1 hypothetical protein Ais01nite_73730 [Asanoa ishikariensis]SDZ64993.1 hypothetical protein SAMN05421684_7898 [Asanoa ishikariensis]
MIEPQLLTLDRPFLCRKVDGGHESQFGGGGMPVTAADNSRVQHPSHLKASATFEALPLAMTFIQRQSTAPICSAPIRTRQRVALPDARGRANSGARA